MDKGGLAIGAVALVVAVTLVMATTVALAGAFVGQTSTAAATSSQVNVAAIPAAMQTVVPYLERAGTLCTAVSAPQLAAQVDVETGGTWNPNDVSPAGAQGLAQFLPSTWPAYAADDDGTGNVSPFNPADAVVAMGRFDCALATDVQAIATSSGTTVLSLMLAAYNAGPGAVAKAGGVPSIPETQAYVAKVEGEIAQFTASTTPAGGTSTGGTTGGAAIVAAAEHFLGTPYSWGGGTDGGPSLGSCDSTGCAGTHTVGFDCSGLVMYAVYAGTNGSVRLPHSSESQVELGQAVTRTAMVPGDVIGFALDGGSDFDHIGIYVGNDQIIDAPSTGAVVRIDPLSDFAGVPWSIRSFA